LVTSDAECTCTGADQGTNAADQPWDAAEEVLNSLRDPGPRAVATAKRVVVTRFQQSPCAGSEARRGFPENDHDRSQLPRGLARGTLRRSKAWRGPDAS
jgi:hypothetical protein